MKKIGFRKNFLKDRSFFLSTLTAGIVVLVFFTGIFVFIQIQKAPAPKYFPLTKENQLLQHEPLNSPKYPEHTVLSWIEAVVTDGFSYNFKTFDLLPEQMRVYFTQAGLKSYFTVLHNQGESQRVLDNRLVLSASPYEVPEIRSSAVYEGRFSWSVRLPLLLTYQGVRYLYRKRLVVDILVARVPMTESPYGLKIFFMKVVK